jgi:hypothetical protein
MIGRAGETTAAPHQAIDIMYDLAGATEVASACEVNDLDCQTTVTAHIERKGLFGGVPNRQNPEGRDSPPSGKCRLIVSSLSPAPMPAESGMSDSPRSDM